MLTFESASCQGAAQIVEKLGVRSQLNTFSLEYMTDLATVSSLREGPAQTFDSRLPAIRLIRPDPDSGYWCTLGRLEIHWCLSHLTDYITQVDAEERPMQYSQVFQLNPDGAGSYYVYNDIFKLIYS